jgi:hypothetical protein
MSPLELLEPDTVAAVPFSVRLAERRLAGRTPAPSDRRAHKRRSAADLEWLRAVRLLGGTGYDVKLVDLSEGGALLEVDAPLRPGVVLTLELSGPGIETAVPLEVLRCYISTLRGETTMYRGACAFSHQIALPGAPTRELPPMPTFIGAAAALEHVLARFNVGPDNSPTPGLARAEVLQILQALQARISARSNDPLSRYTADLLAAILPALRGGASRDVVAAALESRRRAIPQRFRTELEFSISRLMALVERFATPAPSTDGESTTSYAQEASPIISAEADEPRVVLTAAQPGSSSGKSGFQKIVVRYTDGKILKGHVQDFHPSRPQFSLWPSINATPKERVVVAVGRLKAVFFVRDFNGNPGYKGQAAAATPRGQGRRVEVTFNDGESITGTTLNYRPDGQGFFVSPADPDDNNTRIFVVAAALRRVRFL